MDQLLTAIHWSIPLKAAAILLLIDLLLRGLPTILRLLGANERRYRAVLSTVSSFLSVFELLAITLVVVLLLRVNIVTHGLIFIVVLVFVWSPLNSFISGRFLRLSNALEVGQRIAIGGEEVTVTSVGPLSVTLQDGQGTRNLDYRQLNQSGFTIISNTHLSNFLELLLTTQSDKPPKTPLPELLVNCPFLDWSYRPEIIAHGHLEAAVQLKVFLIDEAYTEGFTQLVEEWGFSVAR